MPDLRYIIQRRFTGLAVNIKHNRYLFFKPFVYHGNKPTYISISIYRLVLI